MKPINEMDYLYASGRIRVLEGFLLNRERARRMIEGRMPEEAFSVLTECGYAAAPASTPEELELLLAAERTRLFDTVAAMIPDARIVDVFRTRYDIHNIKVLLKNRGEIGSSAGLLLDCGQVQPESLIAALHDPASKDLPPWMRYAIEDAREILARTGDPQLMDIALDRVCLKEMLALAGAAGSPFLTGYVRLIIDAANLRAYFRLKRMGKGPVLLHYALAEGGAILPKRLSPDMTEALLESLFAPTPLADAARAGIAALRTAAPMTETDQRCEHALRTYLLPARTLAFGSAITVAYLAAKEAEITALRTILTGRMTGLAQDRILERIRDYYV